MSNTGQIPQDGTINEDVVHFKESFETFNKIINDLQRQYLTLENEYCEQGCRLETINNRLRETITANRAVTSFLNSVLTSLSSGVVAVDRQGCISLINAAAEKMLGLSRREALGCKYDEVIRAKTPNGFSALDTILNEREYNSEEKIIITRSGEEVPVSVSTSLLRDEDRKARGAVEIFFDLTKIKKLEKEITRVKTLAALGEMAATVAHEVRNPLGGIGGFAALLKREVTGDEAKERLVDKIITGVNTLNRTVEALLVYTRRDHLNIREIPLSRLVDDCVDLERADQENGGVSEDCSGKVAMEVLIGDRDLKLNCDAHLMRQVLANLLRNSREAMPQGGRITILADRVKDTEGVPVTKPAIWIEVEDTGEGIDEKIREKIFQPFFSTKAHTSGAGLGLATVWKTIKSHNGDITVTSQKGKGTTFRITLPINP